jgi:hypothetical protein
MTPNERISKQLEREENNIEESFGSGEITQKERNDAIRDLERSAREESREEAEQAYRNAFGEW